ncbi:hypothetical protein ADL27_04630, partial [Streptomyces sp. NRRL F-6602]
MKWPKLRRRAHRSEGQKAADSALARAQQAHREAVQRQTAVSEAADTLRAIRHENHFAARFRASI